MNPGLTAVPAQVGGDRCAQHTLVDSGNSLIRNRGGSHYSRCVTAAKSASALDAVHPRTDDGK